MDHPIEVIQEHLRHDGLQGWLLYDFRRSNDIACRLLSISSQQLLTRRFCYWIPAQGVPMKLVHKIEAKTLAHLPGKSITYHSWEEFEKQLQLFTRGCERVAMEYSPRNAIPTIAKVDAGTIELIRSFGVAVVSSADLVQQFLCVWDDKKIQLHLQAAEVLDYTVSLAWRYIAEKLDTADSITDYQVQQFILAQFAKADCMTESPPICALNADSADPHFAPDEERAKQIQPGDFILIDLWCKRACPRATYADITRVGVAANKATTKQQKVFQCVKKARDTAFQLVKTHLERSEPVYGWQVDQAARNVIIRAGYGEYFVHRLGHNIDESDHGDGANLDNLETRDERRLIPGTCFSIEPGIYLPGEFGVRLEYDVLIDLSGKPHSTGGVQEQIRTLLD